MNRNNLKSKGKSLQKTAHTQSWTSTKFYPENNPFFSINNPVHFLNVSPQNPNLVKASKPSYSKFEHHFASNTELISTAFQKRAYVPPHLNSSQVFTCMTSQCQNWNIRPLSASKKLNYDNLYSNLERKYEKTIPSGSRLKKWTSGSKIKNMVEEDRTRYEVRKPYKLYMEQMSGSQPEDEYLNESQISQNPSEQESRSNQNPSRVISISKQSRLKQQQKALR